jgi:hypothetical protein
MEPLENDVSNNFYFRLYIFAAVIVLSSRCLATIRKYTYNHVAYFFFVETAFYLQSVYTHLANWCENWVLWNFFGSPILFAICTNTFSKLCKKRLQWHVEESLVALFCNE